MKKKILSILVMTLLIASAVVPVISGLNQKKYNKGHINQTSLSFPPSGWTQQKYSGNGEWQERTVDGSMRDPEGASHCYAIADSANNPNKIFDVGLFTPKLDLSGVGEPVQVECGISYKLDECNYNEALIRVHSGGGVEEIIGHWTTQINKFQFSGSFDPTTYSDPSNVRIEFYYGIYGSDCGFFAIDNVLVHTQTSTFLSEDFGYCDNDDECENLTVGVCDNFDLDNPPGGEPTNPSQVLLDWIENHYAIPGTEDCDDADLDKFWAHTFDLSGICLDCCIKSATLEITIRNDETVTPDNDNLRVGCITSDTDTWEYIKALENLGIPEGSSGTITLDLSMITGLLDCMGTQCALDVAVQDDSTVDCATLTVCCCEEEPCDPCVEIDKKVWDPTAGYNGGAWVDEMDACICENVKFNITVCNCGTCDLTNIVVSDTLPDCLEYVDGSSTWFEPTPTGSSLEWDFSGYGYIDPLEPNWCFAIEFEAHVISAGENINTGSVSADTTEGSVSDTDTDTATLTGIDCDCLEVEKKVALFCPYSAREQSITSLNGYWHEEVDAKVGDEVIFNITIHNNCTTDLSNIYVDDILPECLEYVADSAGVRYQSQQWQQAVPDTFTDQQGFLHLTWDDFGSYEPLQYCNTIEIQFNAEVVTAEEAINVNQVQVNADTTGGTTLTSSDTAIVNKNICCLNISNVRFEGGWTGHSMVCADITNTGNENCTKIDWSISTDACFLSYFDNDGSFSRIEPQSTESICSHAARFIKWPWFYWIWDLVPFCPDDPDVTITVDSPDCDPSCCNTLTIPFKDIP